VRGLAAAALALLALSPSALGEPIPSAPPQEVLAQIAAAQVPDSPAKVVVGAYINDINSYAVDLYVWFRWKASDLDPSKTMEFMNRYDPNDHQRDELYDKPKQMPDGSLYAIIRNAVLDQVPARRLSLRHAIPDGGDGRHDRERGHANLSAGSLKQPRPRPADHTAGLQGGQARDADRVKYLPNEFRRPGGTSRRHLSRVVLSGRPAAHGDVGQDPRSDRVDCDLRGARVFFVRPHYVEGRIGLGITAFLTLVALQLTSSATLPDVDYLMMLDKIYLLAYVFIIASLARVVLTSWRGADDAAEKSITRADRIWVSVLLAAYLAANAAMVLPTLA
jgi:hypothetical protein